MAELTSRERILRTYHRQEVDRIAMLDIPWAGTLKRWYREGLPAGVDWRDYFGFDKVASIYPDNSPCFPKKELEKTDRYRIFTDKWGVTQKQFNELDSTPEVLSCYYDSSARWEEAKEAMQAYHEKRIPWQRLKDNYDNWKAQGIFTTMEIHFGFDVTHSGMVGTENMLLAMLDEPEWVCDMFDTYLNTALDLCQRVLDAGYQFDGVLWYDDMGYKGAPFFSPKLYRELLQPYHKRLVDWAHERGMVAELHSCGYIEPLLPDVVATGVDMLNPLEVKAGMDPHRLKKQYGDKLAFHGGINAQLWDDIDAVTAEMERIIPVMKEGGGYIFASDHSIPNSVSFENMTRIAKLAHELGKY